MIRFVSLADDTPELRFSPLLRAGQAVLKEATAQQGIRLTRTGAFNRDFVDLVARQWNWPDMGYSELMRGRQFLRETDFIALQTIHHLLLKLRLGSHERGRFRTTKLGRRLSLCKARLFSELIPYYILCFDHLALTSYVGSPVGDWQSWLASVDAMPKHGFSARDVFLSVDGRSIDREPFNWHRLSAFAATVLRPLLWAGLIQVPPTIKTLGEVERTYCKTPLWHVAVQCDLRARSLG